MRATIRVLLLLPLVLLAVGCSRGPDAAGLTSDVQARLDAVFGGRVLLLSALRRQGSAPYAATSDGTRQAIVYYNATLEFADAYDPSDWEGLSPKLIATALGATDEGVIGLGSGPVQAGTQLRAFGSILYRRIDDQWRPTELQVLRPATGAPSVATGLSRSDELVQRLARLVDRSPVARPGGEQIVEEELDRALQNIQLRLDEGATHVVVATGPQGGEYARFVDSIAARLEDPEQMRVATTDGSVANAFMVERGDARFGLVQSDVAAAAASGADLFAATGPLRQLRAVASLFPEPVHVVVRADSGIDSIAQLAGRRVSLGEPGSGTRHTAQRVLAAHGLAAGDYVEVGAAGPRDGLEQLAAGTLDAAVEVISAPWGELTSVAAHMPFRLLPLDGDAIERLAVEVPGIVPLAIPARTYPGLEQAVPTIAATALLVANSDTPADIVTNALETIFKATAAPRRGVSATRVSRERALTGITIPLHEGAASYFGAAASPE